MGRTSNQGGLPDNQSQEDPGDNNEVEESIQEEIEQS